MRPQFVRLFRKHDHTPIRDDVIRTHPRLRWGTDADPSGARTRKRPFPPPPDAGPFLPSALCSDQAAGGHRSVEFGDLRARTDGAFRRSRGETESARLEDALLSVRRQERVTVGVTSPASVRSPTAFARVRSRRTARPSRFEDVTATNRTDIGESRWPRVLPDLSLSVACVSEECSHRSRRRRTASSSSSARSGAQTVGSDRTS